jgi:hypothetical protein
MNHQMGLKLALDISEQEVLRCQLDSLMPHIQGFTGNKSSTYFGEIFKSMAKN